MKKAARYQKKQKKVMVGGRACKGGKLAKEPIINYLKKKEPA